MNNLPTRRPKKQRLLPIVLTLFALFSATWLGAVARGVPKPADDASATSAEPDSFRVLTFNVENLFDTIHDAGFDDLEFLPTSDRHWTAPRYWKKQRQIARVIAAASGYRPVDLVCLVEVENDSVLRDLTQRTLIRRMGYDYIATHGADKRGVDVALLYHPLSFRPISARSLRVLPEEAGVRQTRDVLHVSGLVAGDDTLDVFVVHFPSRGGGKPAERYRMKVCQKVRAVADSIVNVRERVGIIIAGDFNDEHNSLAIRDGLRAEALAIGAEGKAKVGVSPDALYLLSVSLHAPGGIEGSYKFRGQWNELDQMVVSGTMLADSFSLQTAPGSCRLFVPPFLTEPDGQHGAVRPARTYLGPFYHGGTSDHFPLLTTFRVSPTRR